MILLELDNAINNHQYNIFAIVLYRCWVAPPINSFSSALQVVIANLSPSLDAVKGYISKKTFIV